jgi:hypothetical protein
MPINSEHPEYEKARKTKRWSLVRDIVNNDAKRHLKPFENSTTYDADVYKEYAVLVNFTNLTKVGLTGLVFRKPGTATLPPELDYLKNDITGTGLDIDQFGQWGIGELLMTGRIFLLADFPKRDVVVSIHEAENLGLKARIVPYIAENVINWQTARVGSRTIYTKIVLKELKDEIDHTDGFAWVEKEQYRILEIIDGVYTQRVEDDHQEIIEPITVPLDGQGNPLTEIPGVFIGSSNNDSVVDHAPLYDIARINLAHYRDSADLQNSIRIHGQTMLMMSGDTDIHDFQEIYGKKISTGSNRAYYMQGQANWELLQPGANTLVSAEMKRKEEQIVLLGARTIAPPGGRETAEGVRVRYASQNSALHTLTRNMSKGVTKVLQYCAKFMNANIDDVVYQLNRRFYDDKADFNLLAVMRDLVGIGVVSTSDVRQYLRETSVIDEDRTDQDIDSDIDVEFDPLGNVDNESGE